MVEVVYDRTKISYYIINPISKCNYLTDYRTRVEVTCAFLQIPVMLPSVNLFLVLALDFFHLLETYR